MATGGLILFCFLVPAGLAGLWTLRSGALAQRMPLLAACVTASAVMGVGALAVSAEASDVVADFLSPAAVMLSAFVATAGIVLVLRLARGEGPP